MMQVFSLIREDWLGFLSFISFFLLAINIFAFGRISVRHIEREMEKKGLQPPFWDKGMGIRLSMYAFTIIRGKADNSLLIDQQSIIKHARKIDWYLAIVLMATITMLLVLAFIGYFFIEQ